jgi:hypothetical protein
MQVQDPLHWAICVTDHRSMGMLLPTALAAVLFVVPPKVLNVRKAQDVSLM